MIESIGRIDIDFNSKNEAEDFIKLCKFSGDQVLNVHIDDNGKIVIKFYHVSLLIS